MIWPTWKHWTRWAAAIAALPGMVLAQAPSETGPPMPESDVAISVPASDGAAPGSSCPGGCTDGGFDWSKSKYRYQKMFWPNGFPAVPPTGPGYYSLLDQLTGNCEKEPPKSGYPRTFAMFPGLFDADFSYVDKKADPLLTEKLHRIHLGDDWMVGTGGEFRLRSNFEGNSRLTGTRNNYDLTRLRVFGDLWYQDTFRAYVEFIDAQSFNQDLPPLANERNWGDLLNAFVDVKLLEIDNENVYGRVGRQQIILGSQRMISTLDWANTMRTFEGVRLFRRSEKFDIDAFYLNPVIPSANRFDSADHRQQFAGVYTTYRPKKDQQLDTYYLFLGNSDNRAQARAYGVGAMQNPPYDYHTLGFRYTGKSNAILSQREKNEFLWDFENMLQLGSIRTGDIAAGNTTTGLGYHFGEALWNPTFWVYYDYASGSNRVQGPNTFNQYYPLGHYYFGWLDYVGRSNIEDLNFNLYLYPTKWITFNTQYHILNLANARDALYNTNSGVLRSSPGGVAGRDVGSELDFIIGWHIGPRTDIVTAYSHMFAGDFLKATGPTDNMDTFWLLYNVRW